MTAPFPAKHPVAPFGSRLRARREQFKLSLREVELRSAVLAEKSGRPDLKISASWLNRIESGNVGLTAVKLAALTRIYSLSIDETAALLLPQAETLGGSSDPSGDVSFAIPNSTMLLDEGPLLRFAEAAIPHEVVLNRAPEQTHLLGTCHEADLRYKRGIIGRKDNTMAPMLNPGSIVTIDMKSKAIASRQDWRHEFDRPIYLLLERSGYRVGFCELDGGGKWLTLVPHALSYQSHRRWLYKHDVEVIGEVIAFTSLRQRETQSERSSTSRRT